LFEGRRRPSISARGHRGSAARYFQTDFDGVSERLSASLPPFET
jgi:hypothetical protein